jgi:hypothetical protein
VTGVSLPGDAAVDVDDELEAPVEDVPQAARVKQTTERIPTTPDDFRLGRLEGLRRRELIMILNVPLVD